MFKFKLTKGNKKLLKITVILLLVETLLGFILYYYSRPRIKALLRGMLSCNSSPSEAGQAQQATVYSKLGQLILQMQKIKRK